MIDQGLHEHGILAINKSGQCQGFRIHSVDIHANPYIKLQPKNPAASSAFVALLALPHNLRKSGDGDAGVVLAYSNSVAGKLADYSQQRGLGNIGCFYGGMVAVTLAGLMLFIWSRFGDLGKEDLVVTRKGGANLKPSKA